MEMTGEELIIVTRQKGDYKSAAVKWENLVDVHWGTTSGGIRRYTGTQGIYAYMTCTDIEEGEISHSGIHGPCPHEIKVYIPRGSNKEYYKYIAEEAGERPKSPYQEALGTTKRVREIIAKQPGITAVEVASILEKDGIRKKTVANSVRYLKRFKFKNKPSIRAERYKTTQKLYIKENE